MLDGQAHFIIMEQNEIAILRDNIEKTIEDILEKKKIKYISDTMEFVQGLLVGLEIAGIYGESIHELYTKKNPPDQHTIS